MTMWEIRQPLVNYFVAREPFCPVAEACDHGDMQLRARAAVAQHQAARMIEGFVRRVIPVLLALILVPSIAMAARYRCEYDGTTHASCCCPTSTHQAKHKAPPQRTSLRAACCCTVIQVSSAEPAVRAHQTASIDDVAPLVLAVEHPVEPTPRFAGLPAVDRPRALGDPPDTLFARRCLLLL